MYDVNGFSQISMLFFIIKSQFSRYHFKKIISRVVFCINSSKFMTNFSKHFFSGVEFRSKKPLTPQNLRHCFLQSVKKVLFKDIVIRIKADLCATNGSGYICKKRFFSNFDNLYLVKGSFQVYYILFVPSFYDSLYIIAMRLKSSILQSGIYNV